MSAPPALAVFTMAFHSGMGKVACEFAKAASRRLNEDFVFVAPRMESEPAGLRRIFIRRPLREGARWRKLVSLIAMNLDSYRATWRAASHSSIFLMVDLYSTVPFSIMPVWIARTRGARTVLNLHDFYPHASRFPRALRPFERWLYRMAYRQFDLIAAMKPDQVGRLEREAGVDRHKIVVVEHGAFSIEGVKPPLEESDVTRVLILGSLRANKNILESIEAVRRLQAQIPGLTLRIAGAPRREDGDYWEKCQQALRGIESLEATIRYVEEHEMPGILSEVDVMLCPYEGFDSQSGVSIVAVSNGLPLLATDCAKVRDADSFESIARPATAETIVAALVNFFTVPRRERLRRAAEQQQRFLLRSPWSEAIDIVLAAMVSPGSELIFPKEF